MGVPFSVAFCRCEAHHMERPFTPALSCSATSGIIYLAMCGRMPSRAGVPVRLFAAWAAAALFASGVVAAPRGWWQRAWKCRRAVVVVAAGDRDPGQPVGTVTFRTGGYMREDAGDVRVCAQGKTIPHQILRTGPGDRCTVAFPITTGITRYHIYYGNPQAKPIAHTWRPQRGLVLETRLYNGGDCRNWRQMQALIDRSGPSFGRGFVDHIFHGFNVFGPSDAYVSLYRGWLNCASAGRYVFATTSSNASFLFIDGRLLVQWPGWHRAVGRARFRGTADLKRGVHRIEYYHVSKTGRPATVAAWQPPGQKKPRVIPPQAFMRVAYGRLSAYELREGGFAPDFDARNLGECLLGDRVFVRMELRDISARAGVMNYKREWDFGDGLKATGHTVQHVYLAPGVYRVSLHVTAQGRRYVCTQRIGVSRAWKLQNKSRDEGTLAYYRAVQDYDLALMSGRCIAGAVVLFGEVNEPARIGSAAAALLKKLPDMTDRDAFESLMLAKRSSCRRSATPCFTTKRTARARARRTRRLSGNTAPRTGRRFVSLTFASATRIATRATMSAPRPCIAGPRRWERSCRSQRRPRASAGSRSRPRTSSAAANWIRRTRASAPGNGSGRRRNCAGTGPC